MSSSLKKNIEKRRTFGIISHPDAGKTTLTEKLLLFGGAINMAGSIKARKAERHATSDWMAMEQERGISVTTSVMKFSYDGYEVNLLDTPGHQDFSEDTYRVLTAVDSALMVIDSGRGVETQTEKLMDVCRMRNTPIMTFINKLDRDGLEPLEVLADIEEKLRIECAPLTWPVGMGPDFKGTYDIRTGELRLFKSADGGRKAKAPEIIIKNLEDPLLEEYLGKQADELRSYVELIKEAGNEFSLEKYLRGEQTPVFFGSAINNFGVKELLDTFVHLAPGPQPRKTTTRMVEPDEKEFTGMVFKIQANMDPAHRDRIAFLRICSGKFTRGMRLRHLRTDRSLAVNNATIFMAHDREGVEEAYAGDIIGIPNHGTIKIGDTFTEKEDLQFVGIPSFAPELFRRVRLKNPLRAKHLQKGLEQLAEEGAVQLFRPLANNDYILGAIGVLQFDVIVSRLANEYGVEAIYEGINVNTARWVESDDKKKFKEFQDYYRNDLALDAEKTLTYLAPTPWALDSAVERYPQVRFNTTREIGALE